MARHPWVRGDGLFRARKRIGNNNRLRFAVETLEGRTLLSGVNVLSYHNDAASTGQNLSEAVLTPANVNTTNFGKFYSTQVDGQIYGQPLYDAAVNITAGSFQGVHNVAYVVTEHDSLYAIDADTGTILWQDSFLIPEAALTGGGNTVTVTTPTNVDVNTTDIQPEIGITSTPAIDPATGFLFLSAKTKQIVNGNSGAPHYVQNLYKVDIHSGAFTGTVIADTTYDGTNYTYNNGPSVLDSVTGSGAQGAGKVAVPNTNPQQWVINFNALRQMNRSAVTLDNGNVYMGFASHGDNNPYHGWILGYSESSLAATAVFNDAPDGDATSNSSRDGIWMAGGKIAIDPQGYMYVMTGNGTFDTTMDANGFPIHGDYGDSFIKLAVDPTTTANNPNINGWGLKVVDYFTPMNQASLSSADQDLGSGGPVILPETIGNVTIGSAAHPDLLIGAGKQGTIYVIDRNNMGKFSSTTDNVVQEFSGLGGGGSYDTPAFFYDGTAARIYYVAVSSNAKSYTISNATIALGNTSPDVYGSRCATTSISANGTANGIAWNIDPGTNTLRAYNASNMSELWTSAQAAGSRDALGIALKFTSPTVTNGEVFVGTGNALVVYGEFSAPTTAPTAPSNLAAVAASGVQINLTWQDDSNNESGFYIEDSTDGTSFTRIATASVNATSYSVTGLTPGTSYTFRVQAFNTIGSSAYTNTASATTISPPPAIDFSGGFAGAGSTLQLNGAANKIVGSNLQLTDGSSNEASSAYYKTAVSVTRFSSTFTFQLTSAVADGFTFVLQNSGLTAVGSSGSGLGYATITPSVALKFDIFSNNGEGNDSTGVFTNGAAPTNTGSIDMTNSGVILRSGDTMLVSLSYDGTTLQETITDTITHASFSHAYTVNIPGILGVNNAFAGFTGGTETSTSIQSIQSWSYTPLPNPPATPSNLTVTPASGTELDVSWTENSSPVDHFNILRQNSQGSYVQIAQVPGSATMYPDGGLTQNTTYSYEVVASNAGGNSSAAGPVSGTTPIAPNPPSNLQASNITATGVTLTWQDNADNEDGYKIARQLESDNSIQLSPLPANTTTFIDSGLIPGSVYQYTVDAYNIAGPSNGINVVIITLPSAPTGLTAVGGNGQVQLNWTAPKGAASYNVYRGTSPGGENALPLASNITTTSFTDSGLAAGAHYYYQVSAVDSTGEGAKSAEASGIVSTVTINGSGAVDAIVLTADIDQLHIDWSDGAASGQVLINEPAGLTINGNGGSDTITLSTGSNPLPNVLHLNGTFTISGMSGSNPLAGTTLEMGRSTVFINYAGGPSPLAAIQGYLRNGYNNGGWNGTPTGSTGVITSAPAHANAAQTTAIGYADSADGLITGQKANTIELKYTLYGDTTLTGIAGFNDFTRLTQHYNQTSGGTWDTGDFNYDTSVNSADFTLLTRTYNTSLGSQAVPATAAAVSATPQTQNDHKKPDKRSLGKKRAWKLDV